jgi:hypothetical protein
VVTSNTSGPAGPTQDEDDEDDRWASQQTREDDDDGDDGDHTTACNWYTRQNNQPSLNSSMPLQHQPTQDTRSLAADTVVDGNRWNQQMDQSKTNRTIADMDDDHNLT